jgi:hypothetical protein
VRGGGPVYGHYLKVIGGEASGLVSDEDLVDFVREKWALLRISGWLRWAGPLRSRLNGGLCRFGHAARQFRRRFIRRRLPGIRRGIVGSRWLMCAYRRIGCCPAFRARHGVLAVPADVVARLTAIGDQKA